MDSTDRCPRAQVPPSEPSSSIANLNAGRARPPHVRPATSHPKVWVKNHNSKFKLKGIDHRKYCGFGGLDGLFNSFWIYVPEAYYVGARLLEQLAGNNPCSNRPHRPASDSESSLEGVEASFR